MPKSKDNPADFQIRTTDETLYMRLAIPILRGDEVWKKIDGVKFLAQLEERQVIVHATDKGTWEVTDYATGAGYPTIEETSVIDTLKKLRRYIRDMKQNNPGRYERSVEGITKIAGIPPHIRNHG